MTLPDLITSLALTEEQSAPLTEWVAARDSEHSAQLREFRAEHAVKLKNAIASERASQSRVLDAAQAEWDVIKTARDAALADLEAVQAMAADLVGKARAALADGRLSEEERLGMLAAIVEEAAKPAKQREREALEKQKAALEAQLAELE